MRLFTVRLLLCFCFTIAFATANAQVSTQEISKQLEKLQEKAPLEKLFVHTDKDSYLMGDTLWYKTYVMDGTHGGPSIQSGIVYTELHDAFGNSHFLHRQHLLAGSAHGDMILDAVGLKPGTYTLRAYTRWLQNFGPDYFFTKTIEIYGDYRQLWSVKVTPMQTDDREVKVSLSTLDRSPMPFQLITAEVLRGDRVLSKQQLVLDKEGLLSIPLPLNAGTDLHGLEVRLKGETDGEAQFPLHLALPVPSYDIQVLPEGGLWLEDRPGLMGVKVLDPQGKGVPYTGKILDAAGKEVATFSSLRYGMGRVALPALPKGNYQAELTFANGDTQQVSLPASSPVGASLHVLSNSLQSDRISLLVQSKGIPASQKLQLLVISKGTLCYGGVVPAEERHTLELDRKQFPEGILELVLLDHTGKPLVSRRLYNNTGHQRLHADILFDKETYGAKEEVTVDLHLRDATGQPVVGNLSLAVTDNAQVPINLLGQDIYNHYFLGAEIQGSIEDPGFYFSEDKDAAEALDNLLLTQAWVRYDQSLLAQFNPPKLTGEPYFEISGKVVNVSGKGIAKAKVNLVGLGVPPIALDTLTDQNGRFAFNHTLPPFASMGFVITSQNARGGTFNMGLQLDTDTPKPAIPLTATKLRTPWYVGLDSVRKQQIHQQETYRIQQHYGDSTSGLRTIMLKDVEIFGKKTVRNSRNLNGTGNADLSFNEEDVLKNPDRTLYDFLLDSIPGFQEKIDRNFGKVYSWKAKSIILIVDGKQESNLTIWKDLSQIPDNATGLTNIFKSFPVHEIMGVEVMHGSQYTNRYHSQLFNIALWQSGLIQHVAYLEVTTRRGVGLLGKTVANTNYNHDVQFHWPRSFYAPKYTSSESKAALDLRSTLHWEPMLITNQAGKAQLKFFTSQQIGTYTVILQGMDENGRLVTQHHKLKIQQ
jgi:hypothetical protein